MCLDVDFKLSTVQDLNVYCQTYFTTRLEGIRGCVLPGLGVQGREISCIHNNSSKEGDNGNSDTVIEGYRDTDIVRIMRYFKVALASKIDNVIKREKKVMDNRGKRTKII